MSAREIAAILAKIETYRWYEKYIIIPLILFAACGVLERVYGIEWLGWVCIVGVLITFGTYIISHNQIIHLQKELEGKTLHVGKRYGNGTHVWHAIVNGNKHRVTLKTTWGGGTLILDRHVIGIGIGINYTDDSYFKGPKLYAFQIEGEPALLASTLQHGIVIIRLFVSDEQID